MLFPFRFKSVEGPRLISVLPTLAVKVSVLISFTSVISFWFILNSEVTDTPLPDRSLIVLISSNVPLYAAALIKFVPNVLIVPAIGSLNIPHSRVAALIVVAFVIYFYVMYEMSRGQATVKILFRDTNTNLLVPLGLIFALFAVLYATWDDNILKKYRKPGLYVVLLTTIFYVLIFTGIDSFLFDLSVAKWLTRSTGFIVPSVLKFLGLNITNIEWNEERIHTFVGLGDPSKTPGLLIDPRCSGIHSLTIFIAIFLLMLFEARKRIHWNHKAIGVTLLGILGTYLMNLIRITIVLLTFFYGGIDIGESVHNILGYVLLVIWLPIFWLFILPLAEKGRVFRKKKEKKKEQNDVKDSVIEESDEISQSDTQEIEKPLS